ncbi:hypothetical protein ACFFMN_34805 [Planobispora siamensis]|uniref:ABC transporter permease n=1 Tax=Planobispora siamensis TaxID=936338 RepID=A0A8J3WQ82_9ACTN|nr:hypothetical protein [Planobispora siamensis]GIH96617.1 ABC transporter permease [Planobispora siamensis]
MSVSSASLPAGAPSTPSAASMAVSWAAVLRSEWTKLRTLRSTWYLPTGAFVAALGYGYLFGTSNGRAHLAAAADERALFDPMESAFRGLVLVQLLVNALGVLAVTSEYAAGTMPASATAVPRRGRLLAGKAAVVAALVLPCGPLLALGSFLVSQAALAAQGAPSGALTDPGVPGAIAGAGLYLTLISLYGVATGFLIRRTAGAVSLGTFLLLLPAMAPLLPEWPARMLVTYWPSSAGLRLFAPAPAPDALPPSAAFVLLAGTALALSLAAFARFRARDV